jgi:hypothetical protein
VPEVLIPIISVISLFVALPLILVSAGVARRYFKLKDRELDLRREELEVERERVTVLRLLEEDDRRERALLEERKRP